MNRQSSLRGLYVLWLVALAASLPLSHFGIGFFSFLLLLVWIAQWDWRAKWARIKQNRQLLWFSGLYGIYCLGLITTHNWEVAGSRMVSAVPLLLTPIVVGSSEPLSPKELRITAFGFVAATLAGVLGSLLFWMTHTVNDIRSISIFIDHIRFSLCIVFAILFTVHFLVQDFASLSGFKKISLVAIVFILIAYLFVSQTLSGIVTLLLVAVAYAVRMAFRAKGVLTRWLLRGAMLLIVAVSAYTGIITYQYFHDCDRQIVQTHTALGNPYEFDRGTVVENGHRIGYYVCRDELRSGWLMRSDTSYTPDIEQTLVRYLNSQGHHKDYQSVMQMSDEDVRCVERKIANAEYTRLFGLKRALYPTYFGISLYKSYGYIHHSSLLERVELWRASWNVIRSNWLLGVGTGDYKTMMDKQLEKQHSSIAYKHNRGSHNQLLTYWLTGGLLSVLYFVWVLCFPSLRHRKRLGFLYFTCLLVLVASMFVEDTLETQTGRMLFALFLPILQTER